MKPTKIFDSKEILLVGLSFFGDPFSTNAGWTEENEIGRLWNRWCKFLGENPGCIQHIKNDRQSYEVHVEHEETASKGHREVFVGIEVEKLENVPVDLLVKILPAATYAVFTLKGKEIFSDWPKIIGEWMSSSEYESASHFGFELYDERFKGLDKIDDSVLDVYIPIKKKSTNS